ncbi:MAG: CocE/NonD family hydrolase [Caldilineales bacterium]|nr:CocE/NonD family hydrolase [Caldilineales bacterium]
MSRILIDRNIPIPMCDGVILRADVYRPDTDRPLPAILSRIPYDKDSPVIHGEAILPLRGVDAGYAVVMQDTRGRFRSDGDFYPFVHESQDGYDTIEWVAAQPWCDGNVGMTGASYFGATQWLAAIAQPPHLKAIFPAVTSAEYYEGWTYQGGAFQLGFTLLWTLTGFVGDSALRKGLTHEAKRLLAAVDDIDALYAHLPLLDLPALKEGGLADYYFDWIRHSTPDEYWQAIAINRNYGKIQVPACNIGGWYDLFIGGTIENYVRMRQEGGTEAARSGQRLLVGPWSHGKWTGDYPHHSFGVFSSANAIDLQGVELRYFDYHLKGEPNGWDEEAPVRIFVMGENRWKDEWEWPLARTEFTTWFLHSDGRANSEGGSLSTDLPEGEPADIYLFDPRQPCPTIGGPTFLNVIQIGSNAGPADQRSVEARPDVLTYTSAVLDQPLEVTGPVRMELWATSSAVDTDFVARLCDVAPDGASRLLCEGILRVRYRAGLEHPHPISPGKPYHYSIGLVATSHVFLPGHRIRVDVTSSSFPRFDVNPNTGNPLGIDGPNSLRPAVQGILHTGNYPSHIILPVIPR